MGREFRTVPRNIKFEDLKNEALTKKLEKIDEDHKKGFKKSIDALRSYYLNYLEQTNFRKLPPTEIYQKTVMFRRSFA